MSRRASNHKEVIDTRDKIRYKGTRKAECIEYVEHVLRV